MNHHFTPSLAKCTLTPPSLNRQHSYGHRPDARTDATSSLAIVAARTTSPRRKSPLSSPLPSPSTSPSGGPQERRTSWEDCRLQRDGYISFPDFDQLREERELKAS